MLLVRDIMYCKPGKVRPMVEKFLRMAELVRKSGGKMRVLTDVTGERYWTVVAESEVESLDAYLAMEPEEGDAGAMEEIMEGYHELIDHGRREVFTIEG